MRTAPSASSTSNATRPLSAVPGPAGGAVADGRRRRAVEIHRGAGREAGQQLLQGGAEVAAVQGPAGEVRRGQPGQFGALLGCEGGVGLLLLQFTPAVEGVTGQRRRELRVLGNDRGIERLGVHQVEPGLAGLPDVPRARGIGVDDVDVQGGVRARRAPSWPAAAPARSCPGDRRQSLPSGCSAICPRHPAYPLRAGSPDRPGGPGTRSGGAGLTCYWRADVAWMEK